jgi:hypothetical protein
MERVKALLRVADPLYAAVMTPAEWPSALEAVTELLRADHAFLHAEGVENGDGAFVSTARIDEGLVARCASPERWQLIEAYKRMIPAGTTVTRDAISTSDASSQLGNRRPYRRDAPAVCAIDITARTRRLRALILD